MLPDNVQLSHFAIHLKLTNTVNQLRFNIIFKRCLRNQEVYYEISMKLCDLRLLQNNSEVYIYEKDC